MCARIPIKVACVLLGVGLLGGGCATHVPVSESVLFHDGATLPTHENTRGFGGAGTVALTLAPARTAIRPTQDQNRRRVDLVNARQAGGGLFFASYDEQGRYAFAATLGFPLAGADGTLKIRGRNYLTVGYSVPGQAQAFLLHRTANSPRFGAAVGVGGRLNTYSYGGDAPLSIETTGVISAGIRGFVVLREKGDTGGGIKIGTHVGYAPRLNRPIFSLTLTAGRF